MAGLQDFSEAEQLAAYAARYGTALAQDKRRVRLLHRQLFAIHTLEAQAAQPVGLQDGCEAWFIDSLASRLALGGVTTLAELHARMSVRPHWWHDLPGIGVGKARSLERFVAAHATTLGALPAWVADEGAAARAATIPPPTFAVASPLVPLERFLLPDALSGRSGRFRADPAQCHLAATDDREAVFAWLAAKGPVPGEGGGSPIRNWPTARRPSGFSCGLRWSAVARCPRPPWKTASPTATFCLTHRCTGAGHAPSPAGKRDGDRLRGRSRRAPALTQCRSWAICLAFWCIRAIWPAIRGAPWRSRDASRAARTSVGASPRPNGPGCTRPSAAYLRDSGPSGCKLPCRCCTIPA
nr:phage integrase family protein [Cupriavidus sp. EM10]